MGSYPWLASSFPPYRDRDTVDFVYLVDFHILVHIMYCIYIYILYSLPNNSYLPYGDIPDVDRQTAGNANVTTRLYKSMVSSPFRANV